MISSLRVMRFERGEVIDGRYEVLHVLGAGGMGQVYVVRHRYLDRREALKVLVPGLDTSREVVERFIREAKAASSLQHEHIIDVHDFSVLADGSPYYTMERLEGEDLGATLACEGRLRWGRFRHIIIQVCGAIAAAHDKGIIHRDLKPANLFRITRGGDPDFIKVLDFGIAKFLAATTITGEGMGPGSPYYMAPEQVEAKPLDPRVDVYAIGVVLYELLSGKLPYDAESIWALIYAIQNTPPRPLREAAPDVAFSPEIVALIERAMAKDREARYASVQELAAAIEAVGPDVADRAAVAVRPAPRVDAMAETAGASSSDLRDTEEDEATRMYTREPPVPGGEPTLVGVGLPPPASKPPAAEKAPRPRRRARPPTTRPPRQDRWIYVTLALLIAVTTGIVVVNRLTRAPPAPEHPRVEDEPARIFEIPGLRATTGPSEDASTGT